MAATTEQSVTTLCTTCSGRSVASVICSGCGKTEVGRRQLTDVICCAGESAGWPTTSLEWRFTDQVLLRGIDTYWNGSERAAIASWLSGPCQGGYLSPLTNEDLSNTYACSSIIRQRQPPFGRIISDVNSPGEYGSMATGLTSCLTFLICSARSRAFPAAALQVALAFASGRLRARWRNDCAALMCNSNEPSKSLLSSL